MAAVQRLNLTQWWSLYDSSALLLVLMVIQLVSIRSVRLGSKTTCHRLEDSTRRIIPVFSFKWFQMFLVVGQSAVMVKCNPVYVLFQPHSLNIE